MEMVAGKGNLKKTQFPFVYMLYKAGKQKMRKGLY